MVCAWVCKLNLVKLQVPSCIFHNVANTICAGVLGLLAKAKQANTCTLLSSNLLEGPLGMDMVNKATPSLSEARVAPHLC